MVGVSPDYYEYRTRWVSVRVCLTCRTCPAIGSDSICCEGMKTCGAPRFKSPAERSKEARVAEISRASCWSAVGNLVVRDVHALHMRLKT